MLCHCVSLVGHISQHDCAENISLIIVMYCQQTKAAQLITKVSKLVFLRFEFANHVDCSYLGRVAQFSSANSNILWKFST